MTADEYWELPETWNYYELIDGVIVQQFWGERETYHGVRMSCEQFRALGETLERYELINGVVIMSPSPTNRHQIVSLEIATQIRVFVKSHPIGIVSYEIDVELKDSHGECIIYRPDIIIVAHPRAAKTMQQVTLPPDLIVEVISPHSRPQDTITKKSDYERNGVTEYWLIDWNRETTTFYRLRDGAYVEILCEGDQFPSLAVPGFVLDVAAVREAFRAI
jgi:Uma2 family endonuclease